MFALGDLLSSVIAEKRRGHIAAFALNAGVLLLVFLLGMAQAEKVAAGDLDVPLDSKDTLERFCRYQALHADAVQSVEWEIGANPNEGLQPGVKLILKKETVIGPAKEPTGNLSSTLALIQRLVRIPPRQSVEILERERDSRDSLVYLVRWVEQDVYGYIKPAALSWLNEDMDDLVAHTNKINDLIGTRMSPIEKKLFSDVGLHYVEVIGHAVQNNWFNKCTVR